MMIWSREALWEFAGGWFTSEGQSYPTCIVMDEMWGAYCNSWDKWEREERKPKWK